MKCPKDADGPGEELVCGATFDGWTCSRDPDHKGEHHAHDLHDRCCCMWL